MPELPDELPLYTSEEDVKAGKPVAYAHWDETTQSWTTPSIPAVPPMTDIRLTFMVKCPGCNLSLPEEDFPAQAAHLLAEHPEIVAQRRAEDKRFDGWEDG